MDVVLAIVLIVTVPVFYLVGLVVTIRWISRGGRSSLEHDRDKLARDIQTYSMTKEGSLRSELQFVAATLARGLPLSTVIPSTKKAVLTTPSPVPTSTPQTTPTVATKPDWTQRDVLSPIKSMDNINLLLYLGAFLIVVSAGIFVGYNFVTLSGVFKTCFLGLFALVFYSLGLYLYLKLPKLRPAGTTFTGIGLVLLPLVGAAAYNFTSAHNHGSVVWFVTSLVSLACYVTTLSLTRQTYVAYLMAATTLSLFESGISLVQAPVYWYGWGLTIGALVLLGLTRWQRLWKDASSSLTVTANIFVPLSLLMSIVQVGNTSLQQLGVTFGLATVFYLVMAFRYNHIKTSVIYWAAALSALPLSLGLGMWDNVSHAYIAAILVMLAAGYLWLGLFPTKDISTVWRRTLGIVAGLLPLSGASVELYHPRGLLACLVAAVIINAVFARRLKEPALVLLTIVAGLAIPYVFLRQYLVPPVGAADLAVSYLALSAVLVWYRHQLKAWTETAHAVGASGYLMAMLFALGSANNAGHLPVLLTSLVIAVGLYFVSDLENAPELIYVSLGIFALGLCQLTLLYDWPAASVAVILLLTGAVSYGAGMYLPDKKLGLALRQGGLVLPFVGALYGAVLGDSVTSAYALAIGGGLALAESSRRHSLRMAEVAVAVIILAYNWYLVIQNLTNAQIIFLPWSAYFAWAAWNRWAKGPQVYNVFAVFALSCLTLPIAGQALSSTGQLYGLELIFIGLGLVVAGMNLRYKLVTYWGAGTLVAEVLYQLRSVIFALPKYLISAVLGLGLLAVAIILLERRKSDN